MKLHTVEGGVLQGAVGGGVGSRTSMLATLFLSLSLSLTHTHTHTVEEGRPAGDQPGRAWAHTCWFSPEEKQWLMQPSGCKSG